MIVGGYTLHLYCDCKECSLRGRALMFPTFQEIHRTTEKETYQVAKEMGWNLTHKRTKAFAPGHNTEGY